MLSRIYRGGILLTLCFVFVFSTLTFAKPKDDTGKPTVTPVSSATPTPKNKPDKRTVPTITSSPTVGSEKKVTICHLPPGNKENEHTLEVGASAVDTHLAHGDKLGSCNDGKAPEGTIRIVDSSGNVIQYSDTLNNLFVEYSAKDLAEDGKKVSGVKAARFSVDGFNWQTITNLPVISDCYKIVNVRNENEEVESCNKWDGTLFRIPLDQNLIGGPELVEGMHFKYLEVSDGNNVTVVSTSFIYDITAPKNNIQVLIGLNEKDLSNPASTNSFKNYVVYKAEDNNQPVTLPDVQFSDEFYSGVGFVRFSIDNINFSEWREYTQTDVSSFIQEWSKTDVLSIHMQVKDRAGNVSTITYEDSINYSLEDGQTLGTDIKQMLVDDCAGARFPDVCPSHVFYQYIENLAADGVVSGYGDGYFKPDNSVTREQMAKFIQNAFNIPENTLCGEKFEDVDSTNAFYINIISLKCAKIINGYSDGKYKPTEMVTRGQVTKFVVNAIEYKEKANPLQIVDSNYMKFSDVDTGNTFAKYISTLSQLKANGEFIIKGYVDNTFRPEQVLNRGQMSKITDLGRKYKAPDYAKAIYKFEKEYTTPNQYNNIDYEGYIKQGCNTWIQAYQDDGDSDTNAIANNFDGAAMYNSEHNTAYLVPDYIWWYYNDHGGCATFDIPTSNMWEETSPCGTTGTMQHFTNRQIFHTIKYGGFDLDRDSQVWEEADQLGGVRKIGWPYQGFSSDLEVILDETFPDADISGEPDWIDGMRFENRIVGLEDDVAVDNIFSAWDFIRGCRIPSPSIYTQDEIIEIIDEAFKLEVLDGDVQWTEQELEWLLDVLSLVGKDYYYKEATYLNKGYHEITDYPLKRVIRNSADGTKFAAFSIESQDIRLYSKYSSTSVTQTSGLEGDESDFKFIMVHELTHAYQWANYQNAYEFADLSWLDVYPTTMHPIIQKAYRLGFDSASIKIPDEKVCDIPTRYNLNSLEEMADSFALHFMNDSRFEYRYNRVKDLKYSDYTEDTTYFDYPGYAETLKECKDEQNRTIPFQQTDIYTKLYFNYGDY